MAPKNEAIVPRGTKKKVSEKKPSIALVPSKKKPEFTSLAKLANEEREDTASVEARNMLFLACQVFELPPQGVAILGGQPYINKVGWKVKQGVLAADSRIETKWIHHATPSEKYAIVEAYLLDKDGKELARAIGEATEANIKLAAVKQTLNMMAETRAKNRVLYDALIQKTLTSAMDKMQEMQLSKDTQDKIGNAAKSSAEEMNMTETVTQPPKTKYVEKLKIQLYKAGAKTPKDAFKLIEEATGAVVQSFEELTEDMAAEILQAVMN